MKQIYHIADMTFSVTDDFSTPVSYGYAKEYLCDFIPEKVDFEYYFTKVVSLDQWIDDALLICKTPNFHIFLKNGIEYRAFYEKNYYFGVSWQQENKGYFVYISEQIIVRKSLEGYSSFMYLCLESVYLQFKTLFLHSSFIKYQQQGIVFTAPSGTGKSTQASLWEKYENALIVNGDRSALKKIEGTWYVYGLPMCGTSGIHKNDNAKLKFIILLQQSKENEIIKLQGIDSFKSLFGEISINSWNPKQVNIAIDLLNELILDVPIYLYKCTKELSAVSTLKLKLFEE